MSTPDERTRRNALAFLDAFAHAAGVEGPRPMGYLAISNLQLLGLKLGQGKEAIAGLSPVEKRDQINAFIWLLCAPLPAVSRALRAYDRALTAGRTQPEAFEDLMIDTIEPWIATIGTEALERALATIDTLEDIDAAAVTAQPPPDAKTERTDPNS